MTDPQTFHGDRKMPLRSPLAGIEKRFIQSFAPRMPRWIEGYHLTLLTILWTAGLVGFGWLARRDARWLWLSSLMLSLQWFTDSFDGALGRLRDTGIPRWGYYMDHLLDYLFMSAIFIGYAFLLGEPARFIIFVLMMLYGAFEANSWLAFSATDEFKITYLGVGPTEIRIFFIVVNTIIIQRGIGWFATLLPWMLGFYILSLTIVVYRTQRRIWALDMSNKNKSMKKEMAVR